MESPLLKKDSLLSKTDAELGPWAFGPLVIDGNGFLWVHLQCPVLQTALPLASTELTLKDPLIFHPANGIVGHHASRLLYHFRVKREGKN